MPDTNLRTVSTGKVCCMSGPGYDSVGNVLSMLQSTSATSAYNGMPLPAIDPSQWPAGAQPTLAKTAGLQSPNDSFTAAYTPAEIQASTYPAQASVATNKRVLDQQFG